MTSTWTALRPSDGIALFTDGSSWHVDRSGGWAWVAIDAHDGIHADSGWRADTTNNQMELMAVERGLTWLYENHGPCDVMVQSDSEYVVLGMNENRRPKSNYEFWGELFIIMALHSTVEFFHVKGHNDHHWNELVDDLAGKARKDGQRRANRQDQ